MTWSLGLAAWSMGPWVECDAIGGSNSRMLKERVQLRLQSTAPIDLAIIMIGANDATYRYSRVTLGEYKQNVLEALTMLQEAGVTTMVAEILPVIESYKKQQEPWLPPSPNKLIRNYNRELLHAAEATAQKTHYIKTFDYFLPHVNTSREAWVRNHANSKQSKDGIHPTAQGVRELAGLYTNAIGELDVDLMEARIVLFGDSITVTNYLSASQRMRNQLMLQIRRLNSQREAEAQKVPPPSAESQLPAQSNEAKQ